MKIQICLATPESQIGEMAKICYSTKSIEEGGKDITGTMVHNYKHLASLRFAYVTVSIEGISRACANQMVRSSHMDFMQQSMRYVNSEKGSFEFIMPEGLKPEHQDMQTNVWEYAIGMYEEMVHQGVKKEDARAILPLNTSTKLNATANLQGWMSFFNLRLKPGAQTEIRTLAELLYSKFSEYYPQVFTLDLFTELRKK